MQACCFQGSRLQVGSICSLAIGYLGDVHITYPRRQHLHVHDVLANHTGLSLNGEPPRIDAVYVASLVPFLNSDMCIYIYVYFHTFGGGDSL